MIFSDLVLESWVMDWRPGQAALKLRPTLLQRRHGLGLVALQENDALAQQQRGGNDPQQRKKRQHGVQLAALDLDLAGQRSLG